MHAFPRSKEVVGGKNDRDSGQGIRDRFRRFGCLDPNPSLDEVAPASQVKAASICRVVKIRLDSTYEGLYRSKELGIDDAKVHFRGFFAICPWPPQLGWRSWPGPKWGAVHSGTWLLCTPAPDLTTPRMKAATNG